MKSSHVPSDRTGGRLASGALATALVVLLAACGSGAHGPAPARSQPVLPLGNASLVVEVAGARHELVLTADGNVTADGTHVATLTSTGELRDLTGTVVATIGDGGVILPGEAGTFSTDGADDRLTTRHKATFTLPLPRRYVDDIRQVRGVKVVSWATWFGAKDPEQRLPFFSSFAVDQETWFEVMEEMKVEPAALEKWKRTRDGAILGEALARALQVEVGDRLTINSDLYEGDWELEVVGIYVRSRKSVDDTSLVLRWDYVNDDPRGGWQKDQIGWVVTRIDDPERGDDIAKQIDAQFDRRDDPTVTVTEQAATRSFLRMLPVIREDGAIVEQGKVILEFGANGLLVGPAIEASGGAKVSFTGAPETHRALALVWFSTRRK